MKNTMNKVGGLAPDSLRAAVSQEQPRIELAVAVGHRLGLSPRVWKPRGPLNSSGELAKSNPPMDGEAPPSTVIFERTPRQPFTEQVAHPGPCILGSSATTS